MPFSTALTVSPRQRRNLHEALPRHSHYAATVQPQEAESPTSHTHTLAQVLSWEGYYEARQRQLRGKFVASSRLLDYGEETLCERHHTP